MLKCGSIPHTPIPCSCVDGSIPLSPLHVPDYTPHPTLQVRVWIDPYGYAQSGDSSRNVTVNVTALSISGVEPFSIPADGWTLVNVTGVGFNTNCSTNVLTIGGIRCTVSTGMWHTLPLGGLPGVELTCVWNYLMWSAWCGCSTIAPTVREHTFIAPAHVQSMHTCVHAWALATMVFVLHLKFY